MDNGIEFVLADANPAAGEAAFTVCRRIRNGQQNPTEVYVLPTKFTVVAQGADATIDYDFPE